MSDEATIAIEPRDVTGSADSGRLRRDGYTPAVIYGQGEEAELIQLREHDMEQLLRAHGGSSLLVSLSRDGKVSSRVLLREIQHHPVSGRLLHVDFVKVDLTATTKVTVPVVLVGESPGVSEGGVLEQLIRDAEVECLPTEIPDSIEVDISALEIGDSLHIRDLDLSGMKYKILTAADVSILNVAAPRVAAAEEEEEGEEGASEPERIGEKSEDEESSDD